MIIDKNIHRKSKMISEMIAFHEGIPLFSSVEIDVINKCNRKCEFCPVSIPGFRKDNATLTLDYGVFCKLLNELMKIGYSGSIVFSGLSEPLLLKDIGRYISVIKKIIPDVVVEIVTNGDVLSAEKMRSLFDDGLDRLLISLYDGADQASQFLAMCNDAGVGEEGVVLRRRYYENGNYGTNFSNRGGMINVDSYKNSVVKCEEEFPLKKKCYYPFYMLKVDYCGDVTICSHDWNKSMVIGNVKEDNIVNIWKGNKVEKIRKSLSENSRNISPCSLCDVSGDLIGGDHFDAFMKVV